MTTQPDEAESFDLTIRPWIRALDLDGAEHLLSVREVFARSRQLLRIAGDSPQQDAALLRLLLVVLWRTHRDHPQLNAAAEHQDKWWVRAFQGAEDADLQTRVGAYLDSVADRWDLLHPRHPFMQVADLHTTKGEHSPVTKLLPDSESPYFSMRAAQGAESIDLAEAARWLVHLQAWSYSGIKSGAVGDPRVKGGKGYPIGTGWSGRAGTVILHGRTLAETLILNTAPAVVFGEDAAGDLPVWERRPDTAAPRGTEQAKGPCDLLTWQIRRVRLFTEGDRVTGVLVANGDRLQSQNQFADPMTAYRLSQPLTKKAGHAVWMPRAHSETRTLWRGIEPLLAQGDKQRTEVKPPKTVGALAFLGDELPDGDPLVTVQLVGTAYGTQDAVVVSTVDETMPLHLSVLMRDRERMAPLLISVAEATMAVAVGLGQFAGTLQQAAGGDYAFQPDATESLLIRLNEPFKAWLSVLTPDDDATAVSDRWFETARRLVREQARALVAGVSPSAIIGREDHDGRFVSLATAWSRLQWVVDQHLGRSEPRRRLQSEEPAGSATSHDHHTERNAHHG